MELPEKIKSKQNSTLQRVWDVLGRIYGCGMTALLVLVFVACAMAGTYNASVLVGTLVGLTKPQEMSSLERIDFYIPIVITVGVIWIVVAHIRMTLKKRKEDGYNGETTAKTETS